MSFLSLVIMAATFVPGKPVGDPATWFQTSDYPTAELARGISGSTGVTLSIDDKGAVEACSIRESSGSEALDATACAILKARGRFTPARDSNGHDVGFTYNRKVTWAIPGDVALPIPAGTTTLAVAIDLDEKGVVQQCSIVARPADIPPSSNQPCLQYPAGAKMRPFVDAKKQPAKVRITMTQLVKIELR